ncbi:MAG: hypothetical protein IJ642_01470 [Oscillospiraceae bacterium]|nr:hypothetical protein [Oscillospiraceae bacterium]
MCLLRKACKAHGTLGQSLLMMKKTIKIIGIFACLLLSTGCGRRIEQEQMEFPETAVSGTSVSGTVWETTTVTVQTTAALHIKENRSVKVSSVKASETETTETTAETAVSETQSGTELIATEVIQDEANPEETVIVYYYASAGDAGNKRTTVTSRSASSKTTQTTVMTDPVIETAPSPEPEPEPEETRPEVIHLTGNAEEILNAMNLKQKIYQMFIVTPEVLTGADTVTAAGSWTQECVYNQPVGGLIYFAKNLVSGGQTTEMLSNTQTYARDTGIGMFFAVDEEGGLVARCAKNLGTTALSPMGTYGERNDWNEAYGIGQTLGNDIRQFGFNLDFAPVADVNLNAGNELGTRIFSDNPEVVGNMVSGVVQGLQSTGVAATLKHFPGLGAENGNAHYDDKIIIDRSLEDLRNGEFIPFRSGIEAGSDFVMVSHQIITGAGDNLPSCLSHVVCTDWLRNELHFNGILVTDAFNMNTIAGSYSPADSAVMAVEAGVDIILMPTDLTASVNAVEEAVNSGRISEDRINESVRRILQEKEKMGILG